ncbi:MAG: 3-oxoacyl-ACP synthase [Mycobacterium sp.]|uniref:3-oxoacyl-ACP synthase n=1 Tax=Mycobacterium sp. TaxID=1785 RepID=UPI003F98E74A
MGTIIEATATAEGGSLGALGLADAAARLCLERAKRTAGEVDLLINAGVYNDKGISEPAVASLIQEDIRANPEQRPGAGQGTFSFDVRNGGCGMLSGIQLVDGLLASGTVELGLVVGSDIDPDPGVSEGFGFPAVGGAVLLSADDSRAGFTAFRCVTFPQFAGLFQSSVAWQEDTRPGRSDQGRNVLTVEIAESYADQALQCAESTVREMAAESVLDLGEVDSLVATASVPGFAAALATRLGVSAARVASPSQALASAHTAALAVALQSVRLEAGTTALFVSVGAGITVVATLYRG